MTACSYLPAVLENYSMFCHPNKLLLFCPYFLKSVSGTQSYTKALYFSFHVWFFPCLFCSIDHKLMDCFLLVSASRWTSWLCSEWEPALTQWCHLRDSDECMESNRRSGRGNSLRLLASLGRRKWESLQGLGLCNVRVPHSKRWQDFREGRIINQESLTLGPFAPKGKSSFS